MEVPPKNEFTTGDEEKDPLLSETGKLIDERFTEIQENYQDPKLELIHVAQRYVELEKELIGLDVAIENTVAQLFDLDASYDKLQSQEPRVGLSEEEEKEGEMTDEEKNDALLQNELQRKILLEKIKGLRSQYKKLSEEHEHIDAHIKTIAIHSQEYFNKTVAAIENTINSKTN